MNSTRARFVLKTWFMQVHCSMHVCTLNQYRIWVHAEGMCVDVGRCEREEEQQQLVYDSFLINPNPADLYVPSSLTLQLPMPAILFLSYQTDLWNAQRDFFVFVCFHTTFFLLGDDRNIEFCVYKMNYCMARCWQLFIILIVIFCWVCQLAKHFL